MKVIVCVCVYNRLENVKKWLNAWKQSDTTDAELNVIHNWNGDERIRDAVLKHNLENNDHITYIARENVGFDIGCVQDICKERLFTNYHWDYLLWCADDTIPVKKDFITQYINTIQTPECGIACMKVSPHQALHVRTSGWMISKDTSRKIIFPADPITSKKQCYAFEHRDKKFMLINQIRELGLDVRQVATDWDAPLWDSGYWRRKNREHEYYQTFGGEKKSNDKVVFIATIYNTYPQIVSSLMCQTHFNWELVLIHDGKNENGLHFDPDSRIKFIETEKRLGKYGHPLRRWALENLDNLSDASYVVITNADNYLVPSFCTLMLLGFKNKHTAVATYCDKMIHSYTNWNIVPCRFEKGFMDCSGVMVKREVAQEVGWRDIESHSADWTYFSDIASRYSPKNFIPVKGCLLIHN
jgi:hypothetical protein